MHVQLCVQRPHALKFAIEVFNLTIGGTHGIKKTVAGEPLCPVQFPFRKTPIRVESAGFTVQGKALPDFEATLLPLEIPEGKGGSDLLMLLEIGFSGKGTTNAQSFGRDVVVILQDLLTTRATPATASMLGVKVGDIPWEGSTFGKSNNLSPSQCRFLSSADWLRFCAAEGDSLKWSKEQQESDVDGTHPWVGRPVGPKDSFGDGILFAHLMRKVQQKWRLVGQLGVLSYETIPLGSGESDVKRHIKNWLRAHHQTLTQPDEELTFSGAECCRGHAPPVCLTCNGRRGQHIVNLQKMCLTLYNSMLTSC
jgi:hypothetical protein